MYIDKYLVKTTYVKNKFSIGGVRINPKIIWPRIDFAKRAVFTEEKISRKSRL